MPPRFRLFLAIHLKPLEILARPKRFELLTPRFVVWCSIQLSYGRALGHVFNGPAIRSQGPAANVCSSLTTEFAKSKPIRQKFCRECVIWGWRPGSQGFEAAAKQVSFRPSGEKVSAKVLESVRTEG